MSKIALTPNASGTGTLTIAAPNTSTDRTLTLPDETGTVLSSASNVSVQATQNIPVFAAYAQNTDQVVSNDTWTKVQLPSEDVDSNGTFNTSTYTWTPNVAGWYLVSAKLKWQIISGGTVVAVSIKKNGNYHQNVDFALSGSYLTAGCIVIPQTLIYMNGTTDYLELYANCNGGTTRTLSHDANYWGSTRMEGYLVRAD